MKDHKYQIIYADPPWNYKDQGCSGTMANHYPGMNLADICNLNVRSISADNCILFLWSTYPMLKEALTVIESWGFKYKSIAFLWIKLNKSGNGKFFGLGRWTRGNTEPCLLATKGKPKRMSASVFQIIETPIQRHSKKPEEARSKIIELMGDLKKIELFAREKTIGWDVWGNEVKSNLNLL
jgi:N6-adenosine-specific RNA methylase IME4